MEGRRDERRRRRERGREKKVKRTEMLNGGCKHQAKERANALHTVPRCVTELDGDSLRDSPLWWENGQTLFFVCDEGTTKPRIPPVYLIKPCPLKTFVKHYLIVGELQPHKPTNQLLPSRQRHTYMYMYKISRIK